MLSRRTFLTASAAAIAALAAGCSTTGVLAPSSGTGSDQTAASLGLVNKLRAERGLSALTIDKQAQRAAMDQASRMASAGKMEHNIGFGANFLKRMKGKGMKRGATRVRAKWLSCTGVRGKVRLKAGIDSTCKRMWGTITTKRGKSRFDAELSPCGDGIVQAGEQCLRVVQCCQVLLPVHPRDRYPVDLAAPLFRV